VTAALAKGKQSRYRQQAQSSIPDPKRFRLDEARRRQPFDLPGYAIACVGCQEIYWLETAGDILNQPSFLARIPLDTSAVHEPETRMRNWTYEQDERDDTVPRSCDLEMTRDKIIFVNCFACEHSYTHQTVAERVALREEAKTCQPRDCGYIAHDFITSWDKFQALQRKMGDDYSLLGSSTRARPVFSISAMLQIEDKLSPAASERIHFVEGALMEAQHWILPATELSGQEFGSEEFWACEWAGEIEKAEVVVFEAEKIDKDAEFQ